MKLLRRILAEALVEKQRFAREKGYKYDTFDEFEDLFDKFKASNDFFLFAQYSAINKLGLNPSSQFNTPLGIYSYPVISIGLRDFQEGKLPFATDRQYIIAFTVSPSVKSKMIVLNPSGNVDDAHSGIKSAQLLQIYQKFNPQGSRKRDSVFTKLWNETRQRANQNPTQWATLLRSLGIEGIVDTGSMSIHPNEESQAVIFTKSGMQHLLSVQNPVARKTALVMTDADEESIRLVAAFLAKRSDSALKALQKKSWDSGDYVPPEQGAATLAQRMKVQPTDISNVQALSTSTLLAHRDVNKVVMDIGVQQTPQYVASLRKILSNSMVRKYFEAKPEVLKDAEEFAKKLEKIARMPRG